jgi:uncharacterized protein
MQLNQEFKVARTRDDVWEFFKDIPAVASCLPGAEYAGTVEDGSHRGKMLIKVGPFQTSFEGNANIKFDQDNYAINMSGKGIDKKGSSWGKMTMVCHLTQSDNSTKVTVQADVQLSGAIAQIGRSGIIAEIASILVDDFVKNVETILGKNGHLDEENQPKMAKPATSKEPMSGLSLILRALKSWFLGRIGHD